MRFPPCQCLFVHIQRDYVFIFTHTAKCMLLK